MLPSATTASKVVQAPTDFSGTETPWVFALYEPPARMSDRHLPEAVPPTTVLAAALLSFYSDVISPVSGRRCPMKPSCSSYAREVFSEFGPVEAAAMTSDRLLRCGHDPRFYGRIDIGGRVRLDDPAIRRALLVTSGRERPKGANAAARIAVPTRGSATEQPCPDQLQFARSLQDERDYFRAVTEYKRVLHFCRDDSLREAARTSVGECLWLAGQYDLVVDWCLGASEDRPEASNELLAARALYRLERDRDAVKALKRLCEQPPGSEGRDEACYRAALSLIRLDRVDLASECLSLVSRESPYGHRAEDYLAALEDRPVYPKKDPGTAAILGVVPGLGYAYAEHYGTAFSSLLLNGLLIWATVDAFADGNPAAGGIFSTLGATFYLGNIVGSYQSAQRYNDYQRRTFLEQFKE
jgi:putative component of membrane protein insertase Oxa1/YidC/SpoIIIJ protein YidD